ncbi:MAG: hypothetical protein KatS3mg035_1190 [Bacteroidia bacterium]|nr:MAG: hypothetical protein KatS3mg035_1190 [Bacteroidia bacterium]
MGRFFINSKKTYKFAVLWYEKIFWDIAIDIQSSSCTNNNRSFGYALSE